MVWKERRAYRKQQEERKENERKEKERDAALKEAYPEISEEITPFKSQSMPQEQEKRVPILERLHQENEIKREEWRKEKEEIEKRKEVKLKKRLEWKKKFQKRTRKG